MCDDGKPMEFQSIMDTTREAPRVSVAKPAFDSELCQSQLSLLANILSGFTYIYDNSLPPKLLFVSDYIENLTGYSRESFVNHEVRYINLVHPEDRPGLIQTVQTSIRNQQQYQRTYRVRHKNGQYIRVNDTGSGVFDSSGKNFLFMEGVVQEIGEDCKNPLELQRLIAERTRELAEANQRIKEYQDQLESMVRNQSDELRRATDNLKRETANRQIAENQRSLSELRFRKFIEQAGDAIYVVDVQSRILEANEEASRCLGYSQEELVGMSMWQIDRSFDTNPQKDDLSRRILTERFVTFETVHTRKDGTPVPVEVRVGQMMFHDQFLILAIVRDLTERYQQEQERQRLQESLSQSLRLQALGRLAGGIAHDFNNILTVIQGNADLLRLTSSADSTSIEFSEHILQATRRAADMTGQLLSFARRGTLKHELVDVHELISEMIRLLKNTFARNIEITSHLEATISRICGDPGQLENALMNLCFNARDAMPDGGQLRFITRDFHVDSPTEDPAQNSPTEDPAQNSLAEGDYLEILIIDTGVGIEKDQQDRIFEPFFSTKDTGKGTGLGLASVYGCVQSHKGQISLQSEPNKGTEFRILLPVTTSQPPKMEGSNSKPLCLNGNGHVLVVDDEKLVRRFAAHSLEKLGYTVTTCADGLEAVDFYRHNARTVDLVLMDLIMPTLDGVKALAELKKINAEVRAVAMSGYAQDNSTQELLAKGFLAFVEKPFQIRQLAQVMTSILHNN